MKRKILIVEDERDIYELLSARLEQFGKYVTEVATCVRDALRKIEAKDADYDLILLDIMLPDGDGFSVLKRAKELQFPVFVLTAIDEEFKVATYLSLADDYASKDTKPMVLEQRIENIFTRREEVQSELLYRGIRVDLHRGVVYKDDKCLFLSDKEYKLLLYFMHNVGIPLRHSVLLREVYDIDEKFISESALRKNIQRLRQKIEDDPANPEMIVAVPGGYMLEK